MHDDRELTEARLRRFVQDRLIPAIHRDAQPLSVRAWAAPGGAGAVPRGHRPDLRAGLRRLALGPRLVHHLVPRHGRGARGLARRHATRDARRDRVDFGYNRSRSGFQAEGLAYWPRQRVIKSIAPLNSFVP